LFLAILKGRNRKEEMQSKNIRVNSLIKPQVDVEPEMSLRNLLSLHFLELSAQDLHEALQEESYGNPFLVWEPHCAFLSAGSNQESDDIANYIKDKDDVFLDIGHQIRLQCSQKMLLEYESIIDTMIAGLDSYGFFSRTCEEVAEETGSQLVIVQRCLQTLKQLEPLGIFSFDLREYLLRQLEVTQNNNGLAMDIVLNCLSDLVSGKLRTITNRTGHAMEEVKDAIEIIRTLKPYPLFGLRQNTAQVLVPDVQIKRIGETWEITLLDKQSGDYRISDVYLKLLYQAKDKQLKYYLTNQLNRAKLIMDNLNRRGSTIEQVVGFLADYQSDYLLNRGNLKPLTMQHLAIVFGLNESTISRAVANKSVATPLGVIPLKNFFVKFTGKKSTSDLTPQAIKERITLIIAEEDIRKPLSDRAIQIVLSQEGITISRRVIAKYRAEIGISSSIERRCDTLPNLEQNKEHVE
jgi:RNA polymerase sigma-54 factor